MSEARVHQVNVSKGGVPKLPIAAGIVAASGVEGDRQAKPGIHGGPYRALCLFPLEEIERLAGEGHPIAPGTIGENITTSGLDWATVLPNSRLRLGADVVIEITGYADPCKTIAGSFRGGDINQVNMRVAPSSRVYAKVLSPGVVRAGDPIVVEEAGHAGQPLPPQAAVRNVAQVALAVSDLDRATAFYRDGLGAEHSRTIEAFGLAFLQVGQTAIMLEGPAHGAEVSPGGSMVYFEVEDIDASYAAMSGRGVAFDAPPLLQYEEGGVQGWMAFFRDPDGNRLALVSHVTVAAPVVEVQEAGR